MDDAGDDDVRGFRAGDAEATRRFWERYAPLLERVAARQMADRLRLRVGPEDVAQSACRTFIRRAKEGLLVPPDDADGLWRLLCAITVTKVREQARFHLRQKRSLDREVAVGGDDDPGAPPPAATGPGPDEAAAFADEFEKLMADLDDEERQVVDLRLQEFTHDEIAAKLGTSERTVRRVVKRLRGKLARVLGEEDG